MLRNMEGFVLSSFAVSQVRWKEGGREGGKGGEGGSGEGVRVVAMKAINFIL